MSIPRGRDVQALRGEDAQRLPIGAIVRIGLGGNHDKFYVKTRNGWELLDPDENFLKKQGIHLASSADGGVPSSSQSDQPRQGAMMTDAATPTTDKEWENSAKPVTTEGNSDDPLTTASKASTRGKGKGKTAAKSTAKKSTAKKSTAKAAKPKAASSGEKRSRGLLEADVKTITDKFDAGKITLEPGQLLTPHRIGKLLVEQDGLDKAPSTGAISNIITKWGEIGFANVNAAPLAFKGYSARGRKEGLESLKEKAAEKAKKARAAAKAS